MTGPAVQIHYLKGLATTHYIIFDAAPSMKEREDQEKGDAKEEILGGGVGRMERGPDVGDSGSTLIMSRRNLVMTLRPEDRWHFCT